MNMSVNEAHIRKVLWLFKNKTNFHIGSLLIIRRMLWQFRLSCSTTSHLTSYCVICQNFVATCFQESHVTFSSFSATCHIDSKPYTLLNSRSALYRRKKFYYFFSTAFMLGFTVQLQCCHKCISNKYKFFEGVYLMTLICNWIEQFMQDYKNI